MRRFFILILLIGWPIIQPYSAIAKESRGEAQSMRQVLLTTIIHPADAVRVESNAGGIIEWAIRVGTYKVLVWLNQAIEKLKGIKTKLMLKAKEAESRIHFDKLDKIKSVAGNLKQLYEDHYHYLATVSAVLQYLSELRDLAAIMTAVVKEVDRVFRLVQEPEVLLVEREALIGDVERIYHSQEQTYHLLRAALNDLTITVEETNEDGEPTTRTVEVQTTMDDGERLDVMDNLADRLETGLMEIRRLRFTIQSTITTRRAGGESIESISKILGIG